ncbi:MAG: metallophosphoesterase [Labilithrix sp.]|nr:metallophosphoesterase [Labilithrix sp.]
MKRHTLVLSDVHLSQAHPFDPGDPLWMRYRREEHHPDAEFAALVDHLLEAHGDERIEIVFNGDVLDFDAPWVKDGESSFEELPPTDEGCAEQARLILADHEPFFRAVAKALAAGHEVTFMSGNHDIELYWPGVRSTIRDELARLVATLPDEDRRLDVIDLEENLRFRSWFHLTEDRIYFEHGSQYDIHNSVRHAAVPLTKEGDRIHPVLGKLAFRRTGSRMGYFNPYYEETFYMGLFGYLGHFARFYAFSRRHIARTWLFGSLSTVFEIWRHRHKDERIAEGRAALRSELGVDISDEAIDATHELRTPLAEETMVPVVRELWVDRVALAAFSVAVVVLAAISAGLVACAIAACVIVALFVVYELVTPKPDIRTYDSAPPTVLRLFDIHGVRAICMGHTHRPFARFSDKGLYANSGSWCPAFEDQLCTRPVLDGRPVLWLTTERVAVTGEDHLYGGLHWWRQGVLLADPEASRAAPPAASSERRVEAPVLVAPPAAGAAEPPGERAL